MTRLEIEKSAARAIADLDAADETEQGRPSTAEVTLLDALPNRVRRQQALLE